MGRKRRTAAGLCALMLAQSLIPAGTVWAESTGKAAAAEEQPADKEETVRTGRAQSAEESAETARENRETGKTTAAETKTQERKTAEPETAAAETQEKKTTEPETTEPETTEKGNARRQTRSAEAAEESENEAGAGTEDRESASEKPADEAALTVSAETDEERAQAAYEVKIQVPEEAVLQFPVPEGFAVTEVALADQGQDQDSLVEGEDWETQDGMLLCYPGTDAGEYVYQIRLGLDAGRMKTYMEGGEGLEAELGGTVSVLDRKGKSLAEEVLPEETLQIAPFLEKEAEGQGRAQKTYVWTDWVNLGVNPGRGYLVAVIEDLDEGHHFDFEDGQVSLLDSQGRIKAQIPVTEVEPGRSGAFGEIFTAEDAEELLGGTAGAGFYSFENDEEQKDGILIVPVDDQEERIGISYRTRVSASEEPEVYQWDTELECGSKFLWEPAEREPDARMVNEEDRGAEAEDEIQEDVPADTQAERGSADEEDGSVYDLSQILHPVWEVFAERIPGENQAEEGGRTYAAKGIWLTETAACSLVSQRPGEDEYSAESETALWDFLVNQNGENVKEAVITRQLPKSEQAFAGAIAEGEGLEIILCEDETPWPDEGEQAIIPSYEEWEKNRGNEEDSSEFYGYYVLEQDEEGERLELHLFQLGNAACRFRIETKVKDGAFAACSQDFSISSGETEYTAVLEGSDGEIHQADGECGAEIPAENVWISLSTENGYDYEDHSLELEMTVNPQMRSLAEPQAVVTLSDGLEQVEIEKVTVLSGSGREQDITEDEWILAEETEPDERTGESQVIFSWREAGEDEEGLSDEVAFRIRFRCRMSEAMRNESFLSGDEEVLFAAAELTGITGAEGEEREIAGARSQASIKWNSAAAAGEGAYLESRYSQEGSRWDGTRMPRVDWTAVLNRNEGDLTGSRFTLEWPDTLQADTESLRIYSVRLNTDGSLGDERKQIWPEEKEEEDKSDTSPVFAENEITVGEGKLEITLPEGQKGRTLCVEITAFARADMEEDDFFASYRLERDSDVLEEGRLEVSGARSVSILEAAEKNQIPSAAVTLISENSESGDAYGLAGASYRLVRMTAQDGEKQWDSYTEADGGKDEAGEAVALSGENGQAIFLFLEEDTLYKLEETSGPDGYEPWEHAKYLVILDEMEESDFPKADETHELYSGESQVRIQQEESLSRWKYGEETVKGGRLAFYVQDQDGNPLEDVSCSLTYTAYEETKGGRLKSEQEVSGSDGLVVFEGLDPVKEGREGYEIHVTAPYGLEDPAEFSASVTVEEDGTFRTVTEGKAAEIQDGEIYVTCLPATADIRIPVTDQNGNLLAGCGLELQVERLEEMENEEAGQLEETEPEESLESETEAEESRESETEPEESRESETETEESQSRESETEPEESRKSEAEPEESSRPETESEESREPEAETEESGQSETETKKKADKEEKSETRFVSYQPLPSAAEDGSGYITLTDLPYGTYRVFGGRAIMTLIFDEDGVEGWLEPVEAESESGDRKAVRLELEPDKDGIYSASEEEGWYMEEYLPRTRIRLRLEEKGGDGSAISGSRFLVYETWSDRLVGELKESSAEPGIYELAAAEGEDVVLENDRGLEYIQETGILPGVYAVWETQPAEGFRPDGSGVWYFTAGREDLAENEDLYGGNGEEKPFENEIIRCQVPFRLTLEGEWPKEQESGAEPAEVTVKLNGTAWGAGDTAGEYEAETLCAAADGETGEFDQVPVGIYILSIDPDSEGNLAASPGIQVQVRYDGKVIFRTIGGRLLEEGGLTLRLQ